MNSVRTVVFDLDGTLVDTAPDLISALNFVLDREGLPPVPLESARTMIGAGARRLIERGLEQDGRSDSPKDITRLTDDFIEYYAAHIADASRPFDGLESALDDLQANGYRFAVCTNKLEWLSKLLLDRLGLSARFAAICGADTFGFRSLTRPSCSRPWRGPADNCPRRSWWGTPVRISASPAAPAFP